MTRVINVENLSKKFIIAHKEQERYTALRDVIERQTKKILSFGSGKKSYVKEEFWALNDISFEVNQGDRLGIIGRNGAGKSTLLKILSRITEPTRGRVTIKGKVASLLEVGTGFHPELTGRENIFLNGAILGMSRNEIRKKFDEIVAFAEVEKFLDTPVKRYSSGMYVRLAFAVAAHLEPEILVIDEVLAVGDAQFQKKCLGKMEDVSKNMGRTVLFVSHNITAIQSLCNKGILLQKGNLIYNGEMNQVVDNYLEKHVEVKTKIEFDNIEDALGNDHIKIKRAEVVADVNVLSDITVNVPFRIEFEFWSLKEFDLNLSLVLWNMKGECVFNVGSSAYRNDTGVFKSVCFIPANLLNDDKYFVQIYFIKEGATAVYMQNDILSFEVFDIPREGNWYGKWIGIVRPKIPFTLEKIS